MIIAVIEDEFEVNTSESYNKDIYLYDKNVIIPYINLQIFNINFNNKFRKYDRLDFSYLIFKDVKEIFWNYNQNNQAKYGKLSLDNFSDKENDYFLDYVSGTNMFNPHGGCEFKIKFKNQYLYFSENCVDIKNGPLNFWVPINTPNFLQNISSEKVTNFFTKQNVPEDILKLIGINKISKLSVLDILNPISKEEEIEIAKNW